ncbi:MAG: acyl-CoA carboxylase subunit beta [Acidobacteria bacterium]|nr:acyl-CoA carboxylase subunit beta [Acidobacteriota bacterium]
MSKSEIPKKLAALEEQVRRGDENEIQKQHARGQLTARERIDAILDKGSFVEEFMLAVTRCTDFGLGEKRKPTDGVVTGYGTIEGRLVYLFAQDRTVMAGSVGSVHAEKISYVIDTARKIGVPVIGLHDSVGGRIQEGLDVTGSIGKIFFSNTAASGVVPQISGILGTCTGVSTYSPALTDFIFMVEGTSQMFITGPTVVKEVLGEEVSGEQLGGAKVHARTSGVADLVAKDDRQCLEQIGKLLSFLPSNCNQMPPRIPAGDDPERLLEGVEGIVPDDMRKAYDITRLIAEIVDNRDFFQLKPDFAKNIVIGFGRLDGYTTGFVASQPLFLAGSLDIDASDKASRFIRFCDAFNIPVITLVDVPGFYPGVKQEHRGIIRHGAKMLYAYGEATVPKITVYIRKGYGGAKQALCTREMGADQLFVWPGVELAMMGAEGAVSVLYRQEMKTAEDAGAFRQQKIDEYSEKFSGPFAAVSKQFAHAALQPAETRMRLIKALRMLLNKSEERPRRKHGLMPT